MRGVIVIHGLTATPAVVAPVAGGLARAGFKVVTPLLTGHGTSAEDLSHTTWQEWYRDVCRAYDELGFSLSPGGRGKGEGDIFCAGLSLGGLLTLKLALDGTRPLKKIACIGTPLRLAPLLEKFLLPLSHIPPINRIVRMTKKSWEEGVVDEVGREIYKGASYPKMPVHSVWEVQKLQRVVLDNLSSLKIPALIIHSRRDRTAPPSSVELFCRIAGRIRPEVVWLERSGHVVTLDLEKDIVVQKIAQFFS